jgi:N-glycosylase/DNA lyase
MTSGPHATLPLLRSEADFLEYASSGKTHGRTSFRWSLSLSLERCLCLCSISFICSSNNNISRITKMVQGLCNHFSPALLYLPDPNNPDQLLPYHPFPPPSLLSRSDVSATLRALGFGYRAGFIQKTAKFLVDNHGSDTLPDDPSEDAERWLHSLRNVTTSEAREELLKLMGVGRKVADCILLMSLDKVRPSFSSFPLFLNERSLERGCSR